MRFLLVAWLAFSLPFSASAAQAPAWATDFTAYVERVMEENKLPGIAVAVVDEHGPVITITRGYRDVAKKLPVTANTLYAIGSTSKAFTGVLLAKQWERGRVDFNRPVQEYLPKFAIADAEASRTLNLRDLMGHWTGVGRHDLAWYHRGLSRQEMFDLIPHLPLSAKPREKFIYNNFMWVTAGMVAETVDAEKRSWEEQLEAEILRPIGMTGSNADLARTRASGDYSLAYNVSAKGATEAPFYDIAAANPAGGIYSNVTDMAKWLQLHLNQGRVGQRQVISAAALAETYQPYSKQSESAQYAMGWVVSDKVGARVLTHDGGIDGFTANVSWLPSKKIGVVVLMNSSEVVPQWIAARAWQLALGQEPADWVKVGLEQSREAAEESKKQYPDSEVRAPAAPLASYAGNYCHAAYGKAEVAVNEDTLYVKAGVIEGFFASAGDGKFFLPGFFTYFKNLAFSGKAAQQTLEWKLDVSSTKPIVFQRCQ